MVHRSSDEPNTNKNAARSAEQEKAAKSSQAGKPPSPTGAPGNGTNAGADPSTRENFGRA